VTALHARLSRSLVTQPLFKAQRIRQWTGSLSVPKGTQFFAPTNLVKIRDFPLRASLYARHTRRAKSLPEREHDTGQQTLTHIRDPAENASSQGASMPWLGSFSKRPENPVRDDVKEGAQDQHVYRPHARRSSARTSGEGLREGGVATAKPVFSLFNRESSTGACFGADKENATEHDRPVQHNDKSGVIYSRSKEIGIPNASNVIYGHSKAAGIPHANDVIYRPSKAPEVPHANAANSKPFFSLFKRRSSRTGDARGTKHNEKEEPQSMAEHSGKEKPQSMAESETITPHHAPDVADKSHIGSPHAKKRSSSWVPSVFRARRKVDTKQPDPASAVTARAADGGGAERQDAKSVNQHDPQKEPATMQGRNLAPYSGGKSWSLKNGTYGPNGNFTPSHLLNTSNPPGAHEEAKSSEACNESHGESFPGDSNTPTLPMSEQPETPGAASAKRSWSQNFLVSKSPTIIPQRQLEKSQSDWRSSVIWPVGTSEKETTLQNKVPVTSPSKLPAQFQVIQGPQLLNGTSCTHYIRPPAHSTEMNLQRYRGAAEGAHGYQRDAQRHVRGGLYETDVLARRNVEVAMAGNVRLSTSLMTPAKPQELYGLGTRANAHTYTNTYR
jgi:hypothetical protein